MRDGISGVPLPDGFPYKDIIDTVGVANNVSPCLIGAIKVNESGLADPPDVQSADGGHGLMQLTSSWPSDWADPQANFTYAVAHFITPAWQYWADQGLVGENLVRAIAATYNAGLGNAIAGHRNGNVDELTTNNYGARALANYQALIGGTIP